MKLLKKDEIENELLLVAKGGFGVHEGIFKRICRQAALLAAMQEVAIDRDKKADAACGRTGNTVNRMVFRSLLAEASKRLGKEDGG